MANSRRSPAQVAENRRRAILDATLRVVAAGGIDAVTHRRVAAEAGVRSAPKGRAEPPGRPGIGSGRKPVPTSACRIIEPERKILEH